VLAAASYLSRHVNARGLGFIPSPAAAPRASVAERPVALPPERLRSNGMLSDQGKRPQARKRPAELAAMAPKKRAYLSRAAAAYDTQEKDLITKTRKIIAASNRALREAEAVLKRRLDRAPQCARDLRGDSVCQERRPNRISGEFHGHVPPRGRLCRSHPARGETGRPASADADEIRADHQPENGKGAQPQRTACAARHRG
jgi:hypothetical protein